MCVILATIGNNKPTLAVLRACERANPHGGGIAWREGNRVRWEKGICADTMHEIMSRKRGPFLVHFRIATVGAIKTELCHPFPVSGNPSSAASGSAVSVLAHNGTWSDWRRTIDRASRSMSAKLPEGPFSDSRAAAWLVAQVGTRAFNMMGGRFAHFTPNGIKLYGAWDKLNGFHASNLHWRYALDTPKRAPRECAYTYYKGASLYDQTCFELEGGE